MLPYAVSYLAAGAAFLCLDMIWLGYVAKGLYRAQMGNLLADDFQVGPAAAFYALYLVGIVVFAVTPALRGGGAQTALMLGALLGLVAYGTYDLTNWAVVRNWPPMIGLIDLAWGTVLTAIASYAGYLAASRLV